MTENDLGYDPAAERDSAAEGGEVRGDVTEPSNPEGADVEEADPLAALQAELETERAARQAAEERALRYRADFENLRRRTLAEAEGARAIMIQDLVCRLLPVLDDMERALAALRVEAAAGWAEGLDLIYRRFLAILGELGVNRLETVGREFDPAWHEATLRVEESGQPPNTIVEELRAGYAMGDRVIRPALVKVQA